MIVHVVTDRRRLSPGGDFVTSRDCLLQQARYAAEAGADHLQIRERDLEARALLSLVSDVLRITRGTITRVLVNDRLDVALAAGADGVHLRSDSMSPSAVRRLVPAGFLIGRSVHGPEEALQSADADYLIAGTVWPSASKDANHRPLGLDGLLAVTRAVDRPVLAIGGVTVDRISDVARAGASGMAAIGLFTGRGERLGCRADILEQVVRELRERFDAFGSR